MSLTQTRLKEVVIYLPSLGEFIWAVNDKCHGVGDVAGSKDNGYLRIWIDGRNYLAHRLAWLYMTGSWPAEHIDHMDGNGANNRWENLRECSHAENMQNKARRPHLTADGTWYAAVRLNKVQINIGAFKTYEQAAEAIREAKCKHHSFFNSERFI